MENFHKDSYKYYIISVQINKIATMLSGSPLVITCDTSQRSHKFRITFWCTMLNLQFNNAICDKIIYILLPVNPLQELSPAVDSPTHVFSHSEPMGTSLFYSTFPGGFSTLCHWVNFITKINTWLFLVVHATLSHQVNLFHGFILNHS